MRRLFGSWPQGVDLLKFWHKFCFTFFFKFIYFERGRERVQVGRGTEREGDTESEAGSRLQAVSTEPDTGLELTNGEIMT